MKLEYDSENDLLYIGVSDAKISYTQDNEDAEGGFEGPLRLVDYDEKGNVVGLELLDASEQLRSGADLHAFATTYHLDLPSFVRQLIAAGFHLDLGQIAAA